MRHATPLLSLAVLLLGFSCSGSSSGEAPAAVVERFLQTLESDDPDAFFEVLTPAACEAIRSEEGLSFNAESMDSYTVGVASITGDRAEVPVQAVANGADQSVTMLLRKVDAGWRVHGMRVAFGDAELPIDFEAQGGPLAEMGEEIGRQLGEELAAQMQESFSQGQTAWEQGGTAEEISAERARFEAVDALSRPAHDAAWRVDVDGRGRSGIDVLQSLVPSHGLSIDAGRYAEALAATLDFNVQGVSRIEAVERLCASLGLHPVWPAATSQQAWGEPLGDPEPLTFGAGPRPLPATFAGPFLVEVTDVAENTPYPTGEIELTVRALGLAPAVMSFQTDTLEVLRVTHVRDASDRALADEEVHHMGQPETHQRYFVYSLKKDLTGLLRSVEQVEKIAGEVRLSFPSAVVERTFEHGGEESHTLDYGALSVTQWSATPRFKLAGEGLDGMRILMSPRKLDGAPLGVRFQYTNNWSGKLDAGLDCPEAPAFVDVKVCDVEEIAYAFELPPVPLPQYAQRPARLEGLKFAGAAPLTFERAGVWKRENGMVRFPLEIHNVSNKDVLSVLVNFEYLDAEGTTLEDFPVTLTGNYDFELEANAPIARAGATETTDTHAPFAPDAMASIRFELLKAEFADGTRWEP